MAADDAIDPTDEAIGEDEITSTVVPGSTLITDATVDTCAPGAAAAAAGGAAAGAAATTVASRKRNAFTELLAAQAPRSPANSSSSSSAPSFASVFPYPAKTVTLAAARHDRHAGPVVFSGREGLGAYVHEPTAFPPERVIYHDANFVVINDLYPKASVHTLLLARNPRRNRLHPFEALDPATDAGFLAEVQAEVRKLRRLVAKELQRRFGRGSALDQARQRALDEDHAGHDGGDHERPLPPGRDWSRSVISGIHASPSMSHLHIHVLSVDRVSEHVRQRNHYNSFATPFLVDVADFPLAAADPRRHPARHGYLHRDLVCWRCGRNFGNRFARLKEHLLLEQEAWMRE
ncbi:MAG: aprataxin-like protein [Phylliscum demangeonii]|nr:MAG: aprataxin-like protein [Phylliscum demangeonii]